MLGPNGAGKTTLLSILAGITSARTRAGSSTSNGDDRLGARSRPALYRRLTVEENLRLFAHWRASTDVEGTVDRMLEQTGLAERRDDPVATLSGGNQQRINIAIGLLGDPRCCCSTSRAPGSTRASACASGSSSPRLADAGTTVIYSTHQIEEASHYGDRLVVLADGEPIFDGSFARAPPGGRAPAEGTAADPENDFVRFLRQRGH